MRLGIASAALCLMGTIAPTGTFASGKHFNFETATMSEKVIFLSKAGESQAAVEHFFAMPKDNRNGNLFISLGPDVVDAYDVAMHDFVSFVASPGATWESFTDAEKVRAFWMDDDYKSVIIQYEACKTDVCKTDSRATAAYFDAKCVEAVANATA